MGREREGIQLRLEMSEGNTLILVTGRGSRIIPAPKMHRELGVETVVNPLTLRVVIQDIKDTKGENPDKSGKFEQLGKEMKDARKKGLTIEDFGDELIRTLEQERSNLEGNKMSEFGLIVDTINTTVMQLAEEEWTVPVPTTT